MRERLEALAALGGPDPCEALAGTERLKRYAISLTSAACRMVAGNGSDPDLERAASSAARAALLLGLDDTVLDAQGGSLSFPYDLMSATGVLADAAEKVDHLEEFGRLARDGAAAAVSAAVSERARRGPRGFFRAVPLNP